jgi:hypothetical protein
MRTIVRLRRTHVNGLVENAPQSRPRRCLHSPSFPRIAALTDLPPAGASTIVLRPTCMPYAYLFADVRALRLTPLG